MDKAELLALAERVEAGEASDELIIAISDACDMETPHANPLTSLDAALSLVPSSHRLGTLIELEGPETRWAAKLFNRGVPGGMPCCGGATPALALTAAALRAIAAME